MAYKNQRALLARPEGRKRHAAPLRRLREDRSLQGTRAGAFCARPTTPTSTSSRSRRRGNPGSNTTTRPPRRPGVLDAVPVVAGDSFGEPAKTHVDEYNDGEATDKGSGRFSAWTSFKPKLDVLVSR
ncbi:hypothetical protein ColLi_00484 [Colletotrichum liriopes]|uniref:Uncharacterized protein n=1 Tax=Colletotrichum liriopes TaxID=708192 RepID=A0AA37GBZ0_9PEZI|nr:hypothetical protein ColLi_00484 [Colletotrichum liriopes]